MLKYVKIVAIVVFSLYICRVIINQKHTTMTTYHEIGSTYRVNTQAENFNRNIPQILSEVKITNNCVNQLVNHMSELGYKLEVSKETETSCMSGVFEKKHIFNTTGKESQYMKELNKKIYELDNVQFRIYN